MPLQDLTGPELQTILDHAGSFKRFKEMLGIDESELLRLRGQYNLTMKKLPAHSVSFLEGELKRIGSVELFSILYHCKQSEVHSYFTAAGIDIKPLLTPIGHNTGVGRKGELFFKQIRGDKIIKDSFEVESHVHPFDFQDQQYGLVNVKTAQRGRYTAKSRANDASYWDFNLKGIKDCDYLALIPLNPDGEPKLVIMASSAEILYHFPKNQHLTLTVKDVTSYTSETDNRLTVILLASLLAKSRGIKPEEM